MREASRRLASRVVLAASLLAGACVPVPQEVPEEGFAAERVDSTAWGSGAGARTLWRVRVTRGDTAVDTIPNLFTDREVVAVPRMGVVGFAFDTARGEIVQGFRYDPKKKRVTKIVIASDVAGRRAAPALSPDGRHVAYTVFRDGRAHAIVRVFPRGRIVAQGPAVAVPADAPNGARWTSADDFEVLTGLGNGRTLRTMGSVRGGPVRADTGIAAASRPVARLASSPAPSRPSDGR
ncbi:MAG TPA: hypothetical protein VHG91_04845 [Longimicrobium sp.]|nr:hypothetical protein [Longimicrobium sp.]